MQKLVGALLAGTLTLMIFGVTKDFSFLSSDHETLVESGPINPPRLNKAISAWSSLSNELYTPVSQTVWILAARFSSDISQSKGPQDPVVLNPAVFHGLNLVFHLLSTLLVLGILCILLPRGIGPFLGTMIFALHPMQVQAVAWIKNFDLVCGVFFALLATYQYLVYCTKRESAQRNAKPIRHYYFATGSFVLALLSHPAMVVTPLIAGAIEKLVPSSRSSLLRSKKPVWPIATWLVLAVAPALLAIGAQSTAVLAEQVSLWARPLIAGDAITFYLYKLLLPLKLGPDYGRTPGYVLSHWWGYFSWLIPVVICLLLMYWREKPRTWFAVAGGSFFFGVLPFLGFILFENQGNSTVADRYVYLAMIGPALLIAYLSSLRKKPTLKLLTLMIVGTSCYMSLNQVKIWKNDQVLWQYALEVNPESSIANRLLADASRIAGDSDKAKIYYEKVVQTNQSDPDPRFLLANIYLDKKLYAEAKEAYLQVLKMDPKYHKVHFNLGLTYLALNENENALESFEKAVANNPPSPIYSYFLGRAYVQMENFAEAEQILKKIEDEGSLSTSERADAHALLGLAQFKLKKVDEARTNLENAVKLDRVHLMANRTLGEIFYEAKEFPKAEAYYETAMGKMETPDPQILSHLGHIYIEGGKFKSAEERLNEAIAVDPGNAMLRNNLGIAYFNLRQFERADEEFDQAMTLDGSLADPYYYKGDMARWRGKKEDANSYYYKALKIDNGHAKAHYRLGQYFLKQDQPRRALGHFRSAEKSDPNDPRIISALRIAEQRIQGG